MRRRLLALLLLTASLGPLLSGCWDRREVEETAFVLAIGVDKGKQNGYSVTAAIALPAKMAGGGGKGGGGGGGDDKPYLLTTVEAPTVIGAISLINSYVDRRVSLLHTKALFIGEELARMGGLAHLDSLVRFRESRRTIFYIVTKGKAADFLKGMDPKLEKDPQRFIEEMTYGYRYTSDIPSQSQLQQFVTSVNTGYASPLTYYAALTKEGDEAKKGEGKSESGDQEKAQRGLREYTAGTLPRKGGPNVELLGAAAFHRDRMVGVLNGAEMRIALLLQDQFRSATYSIPDPKSPDKYVVVKLSRGRPNIVKVSMPQGKPRVEVRVRLEAETLALQATDYTEPELQPLLEDALARQMAEQARALISKSQAWESDIFGLGRYVVRQFPTVEAWDRYNWPNRYREADIVPEFKVTLRRFGVQLSPPKVD